VVSFAFLFLYSSVFLGVLIMVTSCILTKCRNKSTDIFYAVVSFIECINRLCLLGDLFLRSQVTGVFPLSVCFMNLIATSALGLFFSLLFMTPILAHSPHFRHLWRSQHTFAYLAIEWLAYLAGPNLFRLLTSGFLGLAPYQSDLHLQQFYAVPLNLLSNYTAIFTML
jgi:hypothetical protein